MKPLVTDALWERLQPLLPTPPKRRFRSPGRKPTDYRKILTGILFVLKTGMAWDDLPAELGCGRGKTCRHYLRLWHRAGVWQQLHALLLAELNSGNRVDWQRASVDAALAKAPEGGEDTGPNPTDRSKSGSKRHLMTDAQGIPLSAAVTAANVNEVTQALPALIAMDPSAASPDPGVNSPSVPKVTGVTTPSRCVRCCVGWESRRCWPSGIPTTAAVRECSAGSSGGRSAGRTRSVGCGVASTGSPRFRRPSSGRLAPSSVCESWSPKLHSFRTL
jgi:transposase